MDNTTTLDVPGMTPETARFLADYTAALAAQTDPLGLNEGTRPAPDLRRDLTLLWGYVKVRPWTGGQTTAYDRAALLALVELAVATGKATVDMSVRELAERAGLEHDTAAKALRRLVTAGWLERHGGQSETEAASFTVRLGAFLQGEPMTVADQDAALAPLGLTRDKAAELAMGKVETRAARTDGP
jgi:hypothetical protein